MEMGDKRTRNILSHSQSLILITLSFSPNSLPDPYAGSNHQRAGYLHPAVAQGLPWAARTAGTAAARVAANPVQRLVQRAHWSSDGWAGSGGSRSEWDRQVPAVVTRREEQVLHSAVVPEPKTGSHCRLGTKGYEEGELRRCCFPLAEDQKVGQRWAEDHTGQASRRTRNRCEQRWVGQQAGCWRHWGCVRQ